VFSVQVSVFSEAEVSTAPTGLRSFLNTEH
jgi:hypothetical protein